MIGIEEVEGTYTINETKVILTYQYISHGVLSACNEALICKHTGIFHKNMIDLTDFFLKSDHYKRSVFNIQIFPVSKFPNEINKK